jgi:hypothetical protein
VEQELFTLLKHPNSPPIFVSGVHVSQSLVFCVVFYRSLFVLLLTIVLSVHWFMTSDYPFDHCIVCSFIYDFWLPFWPLYCLSIDLWLLITLLTIVLSVHWFMTSDYPFGHCIVSIDLWLLITLLAIVLSVHWFMTSDYPFDHCIVCPLIYDFWLPFWPLYCLSIDLWLLITLLVSSSFSYTLHSTIIKLLYNMESNLTAMLHLITFSIWL